MQVTSLGQESKQLRKQPFFLTRAMYKTLLLGAFYSMKNSGLNFRKFPSTNLPEFFGNSGEEDNLARYTENFGIYLPGIISQSFPFTFSPRIA